MKAIINVYGDGFDTMDIEGLDARMVSVLMDALENYTSDSPLMKATACVIYDKVKEAWDKW